MTTSQAFRNALHVPLLDPASGNVVAVQDPGGDWYPTAWSGASGLPEAPSDGELYARRDGTWVQINIDPADILGDIKLVDGAGSGLDADLLDGFHASAFADKAYVDALVQVFDCGTF
jgi:hypothetical protein